MNVSRGDSDRVFQSRVDEWGRELRALSYEQLLALFSRVALDGFYKHRDNSVAPMRDEEFYGYD